MKSKITIDVDHDNQPIIKIEYNYSEDVRDKLVKKFLETFGGSSCYASFFYESHEPHNIGHVTGVSIVSPVSISKIRPISPHSLLEESETMRIEGDAQKKMMEQVVGNKQEV